MRWLGQVGVLLLVTLLVAEGMTRALHPRPPRQVLYEGMEGLEIDVEAGVPVWRVEAEQHRTRSTCAEGSPGLAFAGDSVFAAVTDGWVESWTFTERLAQRWASERPELCVHDLSVSGYGPEQALIRLQRAHREHGLRWAVVGVYKASGDWTQAGRYHIKTTPMAVTEAGLPDLGIPVGEELHRVLLGRSALWRHLSLVWATRWHQQARDDARSMKAYLDIQRWAQAHEVAVLWTLWPSLDQPFEASLPGRGKRARWMHALGERLEEEGERVIWIASLLRDVGLDGIAGDRCCHYTQACHDLLAERLLPSVEALIEGELSGRAP